MKIILLDTDVILDFFFDRIPNSEHAAEILTLCEAGIIKAFITPVMVSNIYYLLRKTANHDKVLSHLKILLTIVDVATINKEIVLNAIESEFRDFEDALQNYSADKVKGLNTIVTRNQKDYKYSKLKVLSPKQYLSILKDNK
ncbi:MAG: hypothetical protein RLZZ172_2777 [Bacteroidota bacterium]